MKILLSPHAIFIKVPSILFDVYFPQEKSIKKSNDNISAEQFHNTSKFLIADKYVDKLIMQGVASNEIVRRVMSDNFISKKKIEDLIEKTFLKMKLMDETCDIPIADYLMAHYRERKLAYSAQHPTNEVIRELTRRILMRLGMPNATFVNEQEIEPLRAQEAIIYPCIRKALGMGIDTDKYFANSLAWSFCGTAEEYLRQYIEFRLKESKLPTPPVEMMKFYIILLCISFFVYVYLNLNRGVIKHEQRNSL